MLKKLKLLLGLEKEEKIPTLFEVGVENNRLVIKFGQPTTRLELDKLQTLNLIEALTHKVILTKKNEEINLPKNRCTCYRGALDPECRIHGKPPKD